MAVGLIRFRASLECAVAVGAVGLAGVVPWGVNEGTSEPLGGVEHVEHLAGVAHVAVVHWADVGQVVAVALHGKVVGEGVVGPVFAQTVPV